MPATRRANDILATAPTGRHRGLILAAACLGEHPGAVRQRRGRLCAVLLAQAPREPAAHRLIALPQPELRPRQRHRPTAERRHDGRLLHHPDLPAVGARLQRR